VRRPFKSQEGVALPVAMAMMLVISLFVVAFFTTALQVNDTSVKDRSTKRALSAAEAGLQMAIYRLNRIGSNQPTQCLTTTPTTTTWVALPPSGQCPASSDEHVGNGASFSYYVTPEISHLPAAQRSCVLLPGQTLANTDRCITVIGTSSGVQRRLQVRAATLTGATSYKAIGLMSKSLMFAGNSAELKSNVGVNGVAHFGNSAKTFPGPTGITGAILRAPGSTYETSGSSQVIAGGQQSVATPFVFPPTDFDTPKTTAINIVSGLSRTGMTYTASTKTLRVTGSSASLPAGTW
jgi:Tfp pilus assembly protein PilX